MLASIVVLSLSLSSWGLSVQRPNPVARALLPRQSTGACAFNTCPATDEVEDELAGSSTTGNVLTCTYPLGTCIYDNTSGINTGGSDPVCQGGAGAGGCTRRRAQFRREDNLTAVRRKAVARKEADAQGATARAERAKDAVKRAVGAARRAEQEAKRAVQDAARASEEFASLD